MRRRFPCARSRRGFPPPKPDQQQGGQEGSPPIHQGGLLPVLHGERSRRCEEGREASDGPAPVAKRSPGFAQRDQRCEKERGQRLGDVVSVFNADGARNWKPSKRTALNKEALAPTPRARLAHGLAYGERRKRGCSPLVRCRPFWIPSDCHC